MTAPKPGITALGFIDLLTLNFYNYREFYQDTVLGLQ